MLKIDPEFHAYIPALSDEERAQLEQNIVAEGCRDPLVVWGDILIDGHNRYEICTRLGLPYTTVQREFADREAALDWMDAHQLGRRNLSADARRMLLGRRYLRLKGEWGGDRRSEGSRDQSDTLIGDAAVRIARDHGVSEATVKRAANFVKEVEANPDLKAAIEAGKSVAKAKRDAAPPEPEDPQAKLRREIRRLSDDALIEEIIGLRADLEDAKAKVKTLKAERDDLKAKLAEATQGDLGRALGNAQRRADAAEGRMKEYMATAKRLEFRLKKAEDRVRELEEMPVDMRAA